MRARALACVLTTSAQSTTVFADAFNVLPSRAIFTDGITRETSPALGVGVSGAATISFGMHNSADMQIVRTQACVVCTVFIRDSPEQISLTILVTGAPR